jgi:GNAT superfamily N-acetyltransferase
MVFQIKRITEGDKNSIRKIVQTFWGDEMIAVNERIINTGDLEGLKAVEDGQIIGILHYQILGDDCEILTLASTKQSQGVGSALISAVEEIASNQGCRRIHLTTTNDNLHALGFYQRRGFHLQALYPGAVTKARKLKPAIPEVGENKIPIRDELCLEKILE